MLSLVAALHTTAYITWMPCILHLQERGDNDALAVCLAGSPAYLLIMIHKDVHACLQLT